MIKRLILIVFGIIRYLSNYDLSSYGSCITNSKINGQKRSFFRSFILVSGIQIDFDSTLVSYWISISS